MKRSKSPLRGRWLVLTVLAASAQLGVQPGFAASTTQPSAQRLTKDGDNLWNMSLLVGRDQSLPVQQWMVAALRRNPEAFVLGNIHRLKSGVSLELPNEGDVRAESPDAASTLILRHLEALNSATPLPGLAPITTSPAKPAASSPPLASPGLPAPEPKPAPPTEVVAITKSAATPAVTPAAPAPDSRPADSTASTIAMPWQRWLPYGVAASVLLAVGGLIWRARRRNTPEIPQAVSTLFQDTLQLLQGKPRLPVVSTVAADFARSVEKLAASSQLVQVESEPGQVAISNPANAADESALKLELASAQIEVGRKDDARWTLLSVLREGSTAQQELARRQLRSLGAT